MLKVGAKFLQNALQQFYFAHGHGVRVL